MGVIRDHSVWECPSVLRKFSKTNEDREGILQRSHILWRVKTTSFPRSEIRNLTKARSGKESVPHSERPTPKGLVPTPWDYPPVIIEGKTR